MLNNINTHNVRIIKEYLDDISYQIILNEVMQRTNSKDGKFDFSIFMEKGISTINPYYAFIICLFSLGHKIEEIFINKYIPKYVQDSLLETGLIIKDNIYWQMPNLRLNVINGIYILSSLPEDYATYEFDKNILNSGSDLQIISNIQQISEGKILEISSDSGYLGILSAKLGGQDITIHSRNRELVNVVKFNVGLNGFEDKIKIINSDDSKLIDYLATEGRYSYIVSYLPFLNFVKSQSNNLEEYIIQYEQYIKDSIKEITQLLDNSAKAKVFFKSFGSQYKIDINDSFLKEYIQENNLSLVSCVLKKDHIRLHLNLIIDTYQLSWEKNFNMINPRIKKIMDKWNNYLDHKKKDENDYIFTQMIDITKGSESKFILYPLYNPKSTDNLLKLAHLNS